MIGLICAVRCTVAVWGIEFATTAAWACLVPGTDALTFSIGLSSGMFLKSGGRLATGTYVQGPVVSGALNQRPAIRT